MSFVHAIGNRRYRFSDLRELLAKATPLRSGDALAGLLVRLIRRRVDERDCGDDKRGAARRLGLGLSSLYRKLEELDL